MLAQVIECISSGKSFSAALIKEHHYGSETLLNLHLFSSYMEPSKFDNVKWVNVRAHRTDFEVLSLTNCSIIGSDFKQGDIDNIVLEDTKILGTNFTQINFNTGKIIRNVLFRGCSFNSVKFNNISFKAASFRHCKFLNCRFKGCSFTGVDSRATPNLTTQNSFTDCEMKNVLFDGCSIPCRRSTYNIPQMRDGVSSKSLIFDGSGGYLRITNNTLSSSGLDTSGFRGSIKYGNGSVVAKNNIVDKVSKAIGVDAYGSYSPYPDVWDRDDVSGFISGAKNPAVSKKVTIKKDYPVLLISEGLL